MFLLSPQLLPWLSETSDRKNKLSMASLILIINQMENDWNGGFTQVLYLLWRYTNADLKICWYPRLHIKIICWRFQFIAHLTFSDKRTCNMWKVCLQTFRKRICLTMAYFLRNLQALGINNSRILRIKNAKFSGC